MKNINGIFFFSGLMLYGSQPMRIDICKASALPGYRKPLKSKGCRRKVSIFVISDHKAAFYEYG